jgi:hypothetical protein
MAAIQIDADFDLSHSALSEQLVYAQFCASLRPSQSEDTADRQPPKKKQKIASVTAFRDVSEDSHVLIASINLQIVRSSLR